MRVYKDNKVEKIITNQTDNEEISFEISSNDEVIIDMLRRNYAHPIQTPVQEYLCNARDAMREAGKEGDKILVSLPNSLDAAFKVRDYGVGLSPERVRSVFTKYGESTKRNTNTQTGGYGIGAKSAFIYTDSFTVISYYEGIKYTYLAIRSKNQQKGSFNCVSKMETTEGNGVEIIIPVKSEDFKEFARSVYRATFFWDVRPNITGVSKFEIPKKYSDVSCSFKNEFGGLYKIDTDFSFDLFEQKKETNHWYHNTKSTPQEILVVDGIPYKNPFTELSNKNLSNSGDYVQVFFFKTGEVKLPPHREEIISDKNNESIALSISKKYVKSLKESSHKNLSQAKNFFELSSIIKKVTELIKPDFFEQIFQGTFEFAKVVVEKNTQYYTHTTMVKIFPTKNNPIIASAYLDTTRKGTVKTVVNNPSVNYLKMESSRNLYFIKDIEEPLDKIYSKVKAYLNKNNIYGNYIQILDSKDVAEFAINLSDVFKRVERALSEEKASKKPAQKNTDTVYFELTERKQELSYKILSSQDDDQIQRHTQSLGKGEVSDITGCVFLETEQNNLYKKYKIEPVLAQNVILYLLSQGIKVIAFAEKNRKFFSGGMDFKDVISDVFGKVPMNKETHDAFISMCLNQKLNDNEKSLFGHYFKYLGHTNIYNRVKDISNPNTQYLLKLRNLISRSEYQKERYMTSSFIELVMNNDLEKEIKNLSKSSCDFLKENYVFSFNHSLDESKLDFVIKYINERN